MSKLIPVDYIVQLVTAENYKAIEIIILYQGVLDFPRLLHVLNNLGLTTTEEEVDCFYTFLDYCRSKHNPTSAL